MTPMFEKKLSAKERDDLNKGDFGLPKDRKYPLNDEAHVRSAIRFFKYCEPTKRTELALNINKKLKKFDMHVDVKKDNPFSRFADKKYVTVTESNIYEEDYIEESARDAVELIRDYNIFSDKDMVRLEGCCKLLIYDAIEKCDVAIIESINRYIGKEYSEFISYTESSDILYSLIESAKNDFIETIDDMDASYDKVNRLVEACGKTTNKHHAYRSLCEALANFNNVDTDDMVAIYISNTLSESMAMFERDMISSHVTESCSLFDVPKCLASIPEYSSIAESIHNEIKNDLYIINASIDNFVESCQLIDASEVSTLQPRKSTISSFTKDNGINNIVSEAFSVNEDGDIKISISPKNSYMDSYSSNHKMLVSNWENKNYEAMKRNIAYVFALISAIERSDEYKNKDPEVMKARAFAINDFKTYLKHLQSVEPDFDFVEYYQASEYDKKIINIPKSTVVGIKKLMRVILA
jgi:hypothetical protein